MSKGIGHGPNRNRSPGRRVVKWGKYHGWRFEDVPQSYLIWFVKHAYPHMHARRLWADKELKRRKEKALQMKHERATIINMNENIPTEFSDALDRELNPLEYED